MIHQSELAFRLTAVHYGATATWTQMYLADDLLQNQDVYETARRALELGRVAPENLDAVTRERAPQVVQLAGCDPDALARAARKISPWADGVDLNLGCPQRRAQEGHYGAYLLSRRDWPLVEQLTAALARATELPVSTKLRLCDNAQDTPELVVRLAGAGSRLVTLHARHVAPNRRRAKAAKLEYVRDTVKALRAHGMHASCVGGRTHVLSNGNVRAFSDVADNLQATGADGAMVGEPLLDMPDMFAPALGRPHADVRGVLAKYLGYCEQYPVDVSLGYVHQHVQSIVRGKMPSGRDARALGDALRAAQSVAEMQGVLDRP